VSHNESERAPDSGKIRRFADERESCTSRRLISYFVRLGLLGFGGPVALANSMRHDLMEKRGWLEENEYDEGLAIAGIGMASLAVVFLWKRIPEPVLVLLAGRICLLAYPWLAPAWVPR